MTTDDEKGGLPDLVTFTDIAKRLNERGLVSRPITRQGVRHIADTDPTWPIPPERRLKAGRVWMMEWGPVEKFFREREKPRGRGAAEKEAPEVAKPGIPEQ
ncbi:hypothetical protein [Streptomyces sp. NPDC088736]|uniref:hypothetical protein n=1 Tax=Streptomyces sp. NPDC088736 TaxID=3365881 RepID=UPI0037FC1D41